MKKLNIIPSPGVALVEPIEEKSASGIITGQEQQKRIIKGKILAMGANDMNNYGALVKASNYGKAGDIIYFLSYYQEGGYDTVKIDNTQYYIVKWGDFRLQVK